MTGRAAILPALLGLAVALSGCDAGIRSDADAGLENGRRLTAAERVRLRAVQRGEILREERPFYGTSVQVERGAVSGTPLPRRVEGARGLSLRLGGQADVRTVAAAITAATDIPVNVRTRYVLEGGQVVSVPIGTRMAVSYEGSLSAFLDRLAARMDVNWSYDGNVVTIDRMTRRTWRIALPFGSTEVTESASLAHGTVSVDTTRRVNPWLELEERLRPIAPPPASVTVSRETGRVEVFGPPSVLKAAGAVLDEVAAMSGMRIGLDVAVYFVDSDKATGFGLGVAGLVDGVAATLGVAAGGAAEGSVILSRPGDGTISFEALARDNAVVDYRLASSVAQSGVVTPIKITNERKYLESVTREQDDDGKVTINLDVKDLETGLSIAALPRLVEDRRIQLALTISQRSLVRFDAKSYEGAELDLPEVDNREIRNETVLAPGETLVLSGYEQDVAVRSDSGVGILRRFGIGGETEASRRKVRMVVLVRPTLIPSRRQGGRS